MQRTFPYSNQLCHLLSKKMFKKPTKSSLSCDEYVNLLIDYYCYWEFFFFEVALLSKILLYVMHSLLRFHILSYFYIFFCLILPIACYASFEMFWFKVSLRLDISRIFDRIFDRIVDRIFDRIFDCISVVQLT